MKSADEQDDMQKGRNNFIRRKVNNTECKIGYNWERNIIT